jgi:hypothetical protein
MFNVQLSILGPSGGLRVKIIERSVGLFCVLCSAEIASKVHRMPRSATQAYQNLNLFSCPCVTVWDSSGTATCHDRRQRWPLTAAAIFVSGGKGYHQGRQNKDDEGWGGRENSRKNGAAMMTTTNMMLTTWASPSSPMPALSPGGSSTFGGH